MDELRFRIALFMENNKLLTKLENENWYYMEDALYDFIADLFNEKGVNYND